MRVSFFPALWELMQELGQALARYRQVRAHVRENKREMKRRDALPYAERQREERRASRRALSLLLRMMIPEQRDIFRRYYYIPAIGGQSGIHYRIYPGKVANIEVVDTDGQIRRRLCIRPAADLPVWDVLAAQLLHLQDPAMESRFIANANVFPVYFGKICFDR